jgi:hypothetical protein
MFPAEIELKVQRQRLEQEAENYRLAKLAREDANQPTLFQRFRTRLNTPTPTAANTRTQEVKRVPAHS